VTVPIIRIFKYTAIFFLLFICAFISAGILWHHINQWSNPMTPIERIAHYRVMNNLTKTRMANKLGVTPAYLRMIESGAASISMNMAHKFHALSKKDFPLAAMLGIDE
jgi:DNA-binding XRE family transcriptional regulator